MTLAELRDRLVEEGFSRNTYSLEGHIPAGEGFVLDVSHGIWTISFYERGEPDLRDRFFDEPAACDRFHELMRKYYGSMTQK